MTVSDKSLWHHNFTLKKVAYFGIASGIGALVVAGGTYALTEWAGVWYIASTVISGVVAFMIKFVINALWTFK